ncbi:SgcJ/EcaC family oxidoreductase [Roseinatronobacter monicus]|uniref:SgcJ/EcaC family oxidoreductase n=1 Tax=Roseinatronobacter monicus TaxID=393481 RepID=UPI003F2E8A89
MSFSKRDEIANLFDDWNAALQSRDPATVAGLYAEDAVLLPTVSNEIRKTPAAIQDYFDRFLKKKPYGRIIHQNIRLLDTLAINSGIYTFDLTVDGTPKQLLCRFTFVYRQDGESWKIIEHHSSVMPE